MQIRTVIGLVILLLFISCSRGTEEWKGSIDTENGITVVRNPEIPLYGEIGLDLEEDLSIGGDEDPDYLFYRAADIELDNDANIYVLEAGNNRIQKFNNAGQYLMTIGKKGQGPGEFASPPKKLFFANKNLLYTHEYKKISSFKTTGEFIKSFPIKTNLWAFAVDSEENIIGGADLVSRDPALSAVVKIDHAGTISKKIAEYETAGIKVIVGKGVTFTVSKRHSYSPRLVFDDLEGDAYIYGFSSEYVLFIFNNEGTILRRIHKDTSPQAITSAEKDFFIDKTIDALKRNNMAVLRGKVEDILPFEKNRAFFDMILSDDRGRIYVRRIPSVLDSAQQSEWDIFGQDGIYLYRTVLPFSPEIFHNGFLYDIQRSEETGETKIKRYNVKNWGGFEASGSIECP